MKNKKIILLFLILLIVIFIVGVVSIKFVKEKKQEESAMEGEMQSEFVPQEEISEEQLRETIVSLYFPDKETNSLRPEARIVNVKELMQSPYNILIELLIQGPKNDKLCVIIPENTMLIKSSLEGECLILDFSAEFLNYGKEDSSKKELLINSIVNTVTELNEVNKVKFLIDGQMNDEFNEEYVRK